MQVQVLSWAPSASIDHNSYLWYFVLVPFWRKNPLRDGKVVFIVVEDDQSILELIGEQLKLVGFPTELLTAQTLHDAADLIEAHGAVADIIGLDSWLQEPGFPKPRNTYGLARELEQLEPVPLVIAISTDPAERRRLLEADIAMHEVEEKQWFVSFAVGLLRSQRKVLAS